VIKLSSALLGMGLALAATATRAEAPAERACPDGLPAQTRCLAGQDPNGAYYWIAIPKAWNGTLVVHAHGGPRLKTPQPDDAVEDLQRFAVTVAEGFAWAGSNYRREGFGVRSAAEDSDNLRKLFWETFGRPKRTVLHGQSWGGGVAAKAAELYGKDAQGKPVYDGVILTSGVLGGGTRSYDFRADLRAVYQYYCGNHPAKDEPAYPLWQGQPVGSKLTNRQLDERVNACTGVDLPADQRTAQQKRNLANILAVTRVPERTLGSHLGWATFTFADMVNKRLGGKNPFSNVGVQYAGSDDDKALNAGVPRFAADPEGVRRLSDDSDLTGRLMVPTLTLHAIDDPTAFVELEQAFHDSVAKAGKSDLLVQSFTDEHEHSKLATPEYAALLRAMTAWIELGTKPSPASLAVGCAQAVATYGEACHFRVEYRPPNLSTRSYSRTKPGLAQRSPLGRSWRIAGFSRTVLCDPEGRFITVQSVLASAQGPQMGSRQTLACRPGAVSARS
jgi:pimeloyl-ACP methyl ester carboxylesterase